MAKVKLLFVNDPQGEFSLEKPEITIGRSRECDIQVDNLGVSRHHCSIVQDGEGWAIVDKGSNNGTFMNGERVSKRTLKNNDRIVLGKFNLVFDAFGFADPKGEAARKASSGMGSEMTMFVDPEAIKQMQQKMSADGTGKATFERMVLAVRQGSNEVNCALVKPDTTIGRGVEADVPVSGMFVKSIQAKVLRQDTSYRLIAFGGMRSVKVNGLKIRDVVLKPGDIITIAGTSIVFKKL